MVVWLAFHPEPSFHESTTISNVPATRVNLAFACTSVTERSSQWSQPASTYLIDLKLASSVVCLSDWVTIIITAVTVQPLTPNLNPLPLFRLSIIIQGPQVKPIPRPAELEAREQDTTGKHRLFTFTGIAGRIYRHRFDICIHNDNVSAEKSDLHLVFYNKQHEKEFLSMFYVPQGTKMLFLYILGHITGCLHTDCLTL